MATMDGTAGPDVLVGEEEDDVLNGLAGDDSLTGGDGDDTLNGDEGLDEGRWDDRGQAFSFNLGSSSFTISEDGLESDVFFSLERIVATNHGDAFVTSADYQTDGGDGVVAIRLGAGDDTIINNDLDLRIEYESALAGVDINFSTGIGQSIASGDLAGVGVDIFTGVQRARGGAFDDVIVGSDSDIDLEEFEGLAGADDIDGVSGSNNVVSYRESPAGVVVDLDAGTGEDGFGSTDTLANIQNVVGSDHDDDISGHDAVNALRGGAGGDQLSGAGGDDVLEGGVGDDVLDGGAGADAMDGGEGDDTFMVDDAGDTLSDGGGVDTVISSIFMNLLGGFENLTFTSDAGDVDGQGNQDDNTIIGSDGANQIKASGGDDVVMGGLGDDTLNGQSGDDELHGGDGLDFLTGKEGNDRMFGGADNDQLRGEEGDDHMEGGGAKDRMIGKANNDVLLGQEANDKLFGNSGEDVITGGVGKDTMTGGEGFDVFILAPGDQVDTIKDFEVGIDTLDISAFGFGSFAEVEDLMKEKNGRVQINLDGSDDVVRLNGVLQADLSEGDFILN